MGPYGPKYPFHSFRDLKATGNYTNANLSPTVGIGCPSTEILSQLIVFYGRSGHVYHKRVHNGH